MTDDDALLRVAFHDDERANVYLLRALNELLDNDFRGVGDLFLIVEQDFFPDNFRHEETRRAVGQGVLLKVGRRIGEEGLDATLDGLNIEARERGDGDDLGRRKERVPRLDGLGQPRLIREVDLVNEQQDGTFDAPHLLQKVVILVGFLHHVGHVEQDISVPQRRFGTFAHGLL